MATLKLRDPVVKKVTVKREVKPALYASQCDSCLLIFRMLSFCNDKGLGDLTGTFECGDVVDDDGDGLGNQFRATVCSFRCADEIMRGGWRRMEDFRPFVKAGAVLARCELKVTSYLQTEADLVADWDAGKDTGSGGSRFAWEPCDHPRGDVRDVSVRTGRRVPQAPANGSVGHERAVQRRLPRRGRHDLANRPHRRLVRRVPANPRGDDYHTGQPQAKGPRTMTTIRPLADRILVKRIDAEERTPGGLIIPDNAREKPVIAEVVAVGTGKRLESGEIVPPAVTPGARVLFGKWSGTEIKIDGVEHLVMREDEVLGVFE